MTERARPVSRLAAEERESGEALESLARAMHVAGEYTRSMEAYERAYSVYRREGNRLGAARAARTLAWFRGSVYGDWAVYRGWMGRAGSLLEQAGEGTNEHGWVLVARAQAGSDLDEQRRLYRAAIDLARKHGDSDLECEALASLGIMLVLSGFVDEGVVHLDEALAAVCAGDVEELAVAEGAFCGLFHTCERTHDIARAEQWLRAADDLVQRRNLVAIAGYCRAYYGGILTAAGRWTEAEAELRAAIRTLPDGAHLRGKARCRIADLRVRQGRLEEAGEFLTSLEQHEDAVRPLAALHLASGETALAQDVLERTLARGGFEDAVEGPLLALLVDVHLAAGALEDAGRAADRLTDLARSQSGQYLKAAAALARGKVCVASGRGDARACLHQALYLFGQVQMAAEVAHVQLELAKASAADRPSVAIAEATSAFDALEGLGAARDADEAAALLRALGAPARTGPKGRGVLTKREIEVLDLLGHGLTNAEIGERLFISPKTVQHHVSSILAKLGVRTRAQAVAQGPHGREPAAK